MLEDDHELFVKLFTRAILEYRCHTRKDIKRIIQAFRRELGLGLAKYDTMHKITRVIKESRLDPDKYGFVVPWVGREKDDYYVLITPGVGHISEEILDQIRNGKIARFKTKISQAVNDLATVNVDIAIEGDVRRRGMLLAERTRISAEIELLRYWLQDATGTSL